MSEFFRSPRNRVISGVVAVSAAIGLGFGIGEVTKTDKHPKIHAELGNKCLGLEFASPKGGPGEVRMYVFPKFNNGAGAVPTDAMKGEVISGNDAGEQVTQDSANNGPHGEFDFKWDPNSTATQHDVVKATVQVAGKTYDCPATVLDWDPVTYKVEPGVPGSPY